MGSNHQHTRSVYQGSGDSNSIPAPNFTQIPNIILDRWLCELDGAELKVLLYLCRRTFGFHRENVEVGMRLLAEGIPGKDRGTGLHVETVSNAVAKLQKKGLLECEPSADPKARGRFVYKVKVKDCTENPNSECTEEPNSGLYGKSEQEEKKASSSERKRERKVRSPEQKTTPVAEVARKTPTVSESQNQKPFSLKADDDEPKSEIRYSTPKDELIGYFKRQTGTDLTSDVLWNITAHLETRGATMDQFLAVVKAQSLKTASNPVGLLVKKAKNIGAAIEKPQPKLAAEPEPVIDRCPYCCEEKGRGLMIDLFSVDRRIGCSPCDRCATPEFKAEWENVILPEKLRHLKQIDDEKLRRLSAPTEQAASAAAA